MKMPKIHEWELTGRARVRPGWRARLVLQVEVRTVAYSACPPMPGRDPRTWREQMRREGEQLLHWRDASWEDMQALHHLDLVPAGRIEPSRPWPRDGNVTPTAGMQGAPPPNPPDAYQPIPRPGPVAAPPRNLNVPAGVQATDQTQGENPNG